ncbi:zinc finger protein 699-like [Chelonus insularis]|uniref:zinc finger protein 699-like n=1 Tax=Chelonus insularis TaxID=460826 RepID=UPI0015893F2E|nr:zinc finger protein 699-like [Chelonus insularis]XP_034942096.1 zinc finger protein 699-like [Chelonus insularis]
MSVNYFEMPPHMDRVCRLCLSECNNLSSIFSLNQESGETSELSQRIQTCGAIEIHERDGLPSLICDVCIYKANVAHEFRQQCQHSDARLRLYYNKPARSNFIDSSTQTELQTNIIVTKTINSQPNYFVKQEIQALNQDLSNTIEVYETTETIDVDGNHMTTEVIDGNHMAAEDKLFLCNIQFDGAKEIEKGTVIIETHEDSQQADATEVAISNAIETDQNLQENQNVTIISEMKNVSTEEYINEHLLTSASADEEEALAEEEEGEILGDEGILDEDEEDEEEDIEQEEKTESQIQPGENENKWEKVTEDEPPKRPTRKAKPTGKSYSIDEMMDEDDDGHEKQKFKCKMCSKRYSTHKGLQNHSLVHHKVHKCSTCLKSFYKIENLEKHQKIHESKPHACQLCHACFAKPQSLARHLNTHSEKTDNTQGNNNNINSNVSDNKKDMKHENESDDDELGQDCNQTNEQDEFNSAPGLYKCGMCNQFCSTLKNLKRHALVHGEKKYSCTVCKKWFFRPDTLKKHAEKHGHGLLDNLADENKLYESDDESFNRTSNSNMTSNDQTKKEESDEDGSGKYKCQHCDKIMATKTGLRRHVSMHKPKAEPVTCEICKKVCASQARLVLHQKTHNKPKEKVPREYLCHICSKVYPSNSSLTYHMRTHSGVKPHVCKTCNSGFTTTTSLANHIRIHTGDKPFVCHVCSAAFAVSSAFRRHLTRHTGEANYLCKTCGKAFKRLSTLKEHTYTHSGEKPYVCKTCGAAYSHSGSLFAHQKRCKAQYGEILQDDPLSHVTHHIHINVESPVRPMAFIGPTF